MGGNLAVGDAAVAQVHDDLAGGSKRSRADDGSAGVVDQEALHVGGVSGDGADAGGERIDALVREEAPVLQSDDVFGDVLELGDHVRGDEEGAPRAAPLHAVGGQGEQLLVEGIASGHVQGCLNLVEDGDGSSGGQRDGTREDSGLAGGDLA